MFDCCWQRRVHVYLLWVLSVGRGCRRGLDGFRCCL